jgi:cytochrome c553
MFNSRLLGGLTLACASLAIASSVRAEELKTGEQIYSAMCAQCHGAAGEGTPDNYATPLIGDKSVLELAALIDKTMPEGEPEKCDAEQSRLVAEYIYNAFYSPTAQARNEPARIELSRLTVRQYQNSVADLVASFRSPSQWGSERGLKASYFKGRQFRTDDRVAERIDPQVKFDFGERGPQLAELKEDPFDPYEFSIRWEGAVFAADSGDYEFIVRTDHAARLWINSQQAPLIDAWVKSGDDNEYRGSIKLLGGRPYYLKLEFSKAKQGVNDSDKNKTRPLKKAGIELAWKPPHRPEETISERSLAPQGTAELFVVSAPFPPDDRSRGYERGTSISKEWEAATTDAAIETAGYVAERLGELAGLGGGRGRTDGRGGRGRGAPPPEPMTDVSERDQKVREFATRFVERAFRRPLGEAERQTYIDAQFAATPDTETAVKRVVLLTLKSPRFLYRELQAGSTDPYDVASRLSFGMWDSLPDRELLAAAAEGKLTSRDDVRAQAERMLPDIRTRSKVREFFLRWLKIDHPPDMAKSKEHYPEFDEQVIADLRTSLEIFLDEVIWGEKSDFRELLLAESVPLNARLAQIYGGDIAEGNFKQVPLAGEDRAGLLSHPYLLAAFAYTEESSPIHRGVFISRSLLGRALRPPPVAVAPLAPDLHANLTTRERVELQTNADSCKSCHAMINPLGFTLEHYDAIGRYRAEEKGKPIDATGKYITQAGQEIEFHSVRELAKFLAESDEARQALVQQLFHYQIKQPIRAYGEDRAKNLSTAFAENGYNIRQLVAELVASAALP